MMMSTRAHKVEDLVTCALTGMEVAMGDGTADEMLSACLTSALRAVQSAWGMADGDGRQRIKEAVAILALSCVGTGETVN